MASVAIPMVAGFVVNKIGESQGWDPRMTAVLGMAAGYGVGGLVAGAASSAASSAAASSFNPGTVGAATNAFNPMTTGVMAGRSAASSLGTAASHGSAGALAEMATPTGSNYYRPPYLMDDPTFSPRGWQGEITRTPQPGNPWQGFDAPQDYSKWESPHTMTEGFGKFHDANTTRPVDDQGRETGFSPLENLGVSMIKTLTTDLPEQRMSGGGGGGGGGGPLMPAYNGGGGSSQKAQTWGFGGQQGGYNPQGIA